MTPAFCIGLGAYLCVGVVVVVLLYRLSVATGHRYEGKSVPTSVLTIDLLVLVVGWPILVVLVVVCVIAWAIDGCHPEDSEDQQGDEE